MGLLLVPTRFELDHLHDVVGQLSSCQWTVAVCGFGPIIAAAQTVKLIERVQPELVVLAGIAGAIDDRLEIATAHEFSSVVCHGVGVGSGDRYRPLEIPSELTSTSPSDGASTGPLPLACSGGLQLLTCCAASDSPQEIAMKAQQFPEAVAEDMEGYGVAVACALHETPLRIVRGMSNQAGHRDKSQWQVDAALKSVATMVTHIVYGEL